MDTALSKFLERRAPSLCLCNSINFSVIALGLPRGLGEDGELFLVVPSMTFDDDVDCEEEDDGVDSADDEECVFLHTVLCSFQCKR